MDWYFQMIAFNRFLRQFLSINSIRLSYNQQWYRNVRCVSTNHNLQSKEFRKKTENFSFNTEPNADADSDVFGTLIDKVETNEKLDILPPEPDDKIQYDKDEQHKRLYITEYHKIIQELIKQHKVQNNSILSDIITFYTDI